MYIISYRPALFVLSLLVGLSTLFFGAKFSLAQGLMPVFCALVTVLTLPLAVSIPAKRSHKALVIGVFALSSFIVTLGVIQLLPLGNGLENQFWSLANAGMGSISLAPGVTMAHTVYAAGLWLLAVSAYRLGSNHAVNVLRVVAVVITLACTYGIIQFAFGNGYVLWLPKTSYQMVLSGTFINRNSFATLAGLGMLLNFGLMLQRVGEVSSRLTTRQRFKAFWLLVLRPGWGWMSFALICFIALLLTGSRAGITASLCGVLVLFGSLAGMREAVRWSLASLIGVFIAFSLFMLAALGTDLGARLLKVSEDASIRQDINIGSLQLIDQFGWTGTGLGTYMNAFYTVHAPETLARLNGIIDHAHNTYLELAVELGLPVLVLAGISVILLAAAYLVGLGVRRRAIMWPALGISTLVLVGGHAMADFSLSTPAFAAATIIVLMLALARSLPVAEVSAPAYQPARWAILALSVVIMVIAAWQSWANYQAFKASSTLRQLASVNAVGPGPLFVAQRHLMRCVAVNPWHPTCNEGLAQVQMSLATGYGFKGPRGDIGMVYLSMARDTYLTVVNQSPVNPLAWYRLARIEAFLGNKPKAQEYLANSILTGPAEPGLATQRLPLMLEILPQATPENESLFTGNILAHWAASPYRVGLELRVHHAVHPQFAGLLDDSADTRAKWKHYIRAPFPVQAPLGDAPEKR